MLAAQRAQAPHPDRIGPPVLEEPAAPQRLVRLAAAEARPDLHELIDAAESRGVRHVLDERQLTLGAGCGGVTWPLESLPAVDEVPWATVHEIPVVAVTGASGAATTARLIAACAYARGWHAGLSGSDGIHVGGRRIDAGDHRGRSGARRVLRDRRVEAAVLEMSRAGILRGGLAIDHATAAVVTAVGGEPGGEFGVDDVEGLADARMVVAPLVPRNGLLVLNADEPTLCPRANGLEQRLGWRPPVGWSALDYDHERLASHRAGSGSTCGARSGRLWLSYADREYDLGAIEAMPVTRGDDTRRNVGALAAAALAAAALDIAPATIASAFARFGNEA